MGFSTLLLLIGGMWQIGDVKMCNVPLLVQWQIFEAIRTKFFAALMTWEYA